MSSDVVGRPRYSAALVAELADLLGLDANASWVDVGGSWSLNLRVVDQRRGTVVVRVHRPETSTSRLAAEQQARTVLARAGLPTVLPGANSTGRSIHTLASGPVVEMEPFIHSNATMKGPARLVTGYALLARVHNVLRQASLPPQAHTVARSNHVAAESAAAATRLGAARIRGWGTPDLTRFADQVVDHVDSVAALEGAFAASLPRQVVHGDYWDNNVLFDGERIVGVLDFGFMAERARIDDLALPIWFHLLEPGHALATLGDVRLVARMVDAYDAASSHPLSPMERYVLPLTIARQPAWSVGQWVTSLDEPTAIAHARAAADELVVAQAVLTNLGKWQQALKPRRA